MVSLIVGRGAGAHGAGILYFAGVAAGMFRETCLASLVLLNNARGRRTIFHAALQRKSGSENGENCCLVIATLRLEDAIERSVTYDAAGGQTR
jgi:hypothetical protein